MNGSCVNKAVKGLQKLSKRPRKKLMPPISAGATLTRRVFLKRYKPKTDRNCEFVVYIGPRKQWKEFLKRKY